MIEREITGLLVKLFSLYPFVTVTGPRQSGKTTLCRETFPELRYANLELPEQRDFAKEDPRGFLASLDGNGIIDEIQRVPDLVSYLQVYADETRNNGLFVLTGSERFEVTNAISQSLAGRTALLNLLPFTISERARTGAGTELNEVLYSGFYPRIHDQRIEPRRALSDYFATFVERDIQRLGGIRDLATFEIFTRLCAGRVGRLTDLVALGRDAGVSHTTARNWLNTLEASYIAFRLQPLHANIRKRLTKSPKLYFYDVGLAAHLLGIEGADQLTTHPMRGALFENMVVVEALKYRFNKGQTSNISFFRDNHGLECDLLIDRAGKQTLVEIKSGATIPSDVSASLNAVDRALDGVEARIVVYGGNIRQTRKNLDVIPFDQFQDALARLEIDQDLSTLAETIAQKPNESSAQNLLNDAHKYWITPMIDAMVGALDKLKPMFELVDHSEFIEIGDEVVISSKSLAAEAWESTKQEQLENGLTSLTTQAPIRMVHITKLEEFAHRYNGDLTIEVRIEWTFTKHGLKQAVVIDGNPLNVTENETIAYEMLARSGARPDFVCGNVLRHIRNRIVHGPNQSS